MAAFDLLGGLLGGGPGGDPKGGPGAGCGCPPPPKHEGCGDDWGWEKQRGCKPRHHHEKHCGHHHH